MLPETEFIKKILDRLEPDRSAGLLKGIGDDCAVLAQSGTKVTLVTIDSLVEKIHFDLSWHPPYLLGRKAAAVNISDIAAMGGVPRFALLSVAAPANYKQHLLDKFMAGFLDMLDEFAIILVGGDTVSSQELTFSVTVLGEMAEDEVLYRSGAREGDLIWVSGHLGQAGAGLELCRTHPHEKYQWPELVQAHLDPSPAVKLGRVLAASRLVSAMMDISDGIATDLAHICAASSVGAEITADSLPLSPALKEVASRLNFDPLQPALRGGEDYHLLFTSPAANSGRLEQLVKEKTGKDIYRVGKIIAGDGVKLRGNNGQTSDITFQGYEHNSSKLTWAANQKTQPAILLDDSDQ